MSRSDWSDHAWHLVHAEPQAPALHMALDEVMLDDVAAGRRPPTLRIWEWAGPAVVMGRFQALRNEVDAQAERRHGIEAVRRISGGGALFIEPGNTIHYSIPRSQEPRVGQERVGTGSFRWSPNHHKK